MPEKISKKGKNGKPKKRNFVHPSLKVHPAPELKEEPEPESITKPAIRN